MAGIGGPLTAAEIEFLAECEPVTIVPNFSLDVFQFIGVRFFVLVARERSVAVSFDLFLHSFFFLHFFLSCR